jgi:phage baseplate assembly protein V
MKEARMIAEQGFLLSEMNRRLLQIVRIGVIQEIDYAKAKARVKIGDNVTGWRPWVSLAKGWIPPVVGDQVVVLSPNGDFEQGIILSALYHSKSKPPSDKENEIKFKLSENSSFCFDSNLEKLTVQIGPHTLELNALVLFLNNMPLLPGI